MAATVTDRLDDRALPVVPDSSGRRWDIAGAVGALTFASLVIVDNILRVTQPGPDAPIRDVMAWYSGNQAAATIACGTFAINIVALLTFVSVIGRRAEVRGDGGVIWGQFGRASAVLIAAFFGLTSILDASLSQSTAADPGLFAMIWRIHWTTFTLNLAAIGGALLGLGMAARSAGIIPRWMAVVAVVGAVMLIAGAIPLVAAASGTPVFKAVLPGFAAWVLFLVVAAVGLLRRREAA